MLQNCILLLEVVAALPFFFRSTVMLWPSSRRQMILGVGNPSARHVMLMFWFSRTATDDGVLSMSRMFGGTEMKENGKDNKDEHKIRIRSSLDWK